MNRENWLKRIAGVLCLCVLCVSCMSQPWEDGKEKTISEQIKDYIWAQMNVLRLPSALMRVEEEAFRGTAVEKVLFPEGAQIIGAGAFGDADRLGMIYLPSSLREIGENAFESGGGILLIGESGSLGEDWAKENQFPFAQKEIWLFRALRTNESQQDLLKERQRASDSDAEDVLALEREYRRDRSPVQALSTRRRERAELDYQTGLFP